MFTLLETYDVEILTPLSIASVDNAFVFISAIEEHILEVRVVMTVAHKFIGIAPTN